MSEKTEVREGKEETKRKKIERSTVLIERQRLGQGSHILPAQFSKL